MEDDASLLTEEDIQKIYDQLEDIDKTMIGYIALQLEDNFKKMWNAGNHITNANFGPKQALELICKLSIFLFKRYGPDLRDWNLGEESTTNLSNATRPERVEQI
jgi:hypothetical protein